MRSTVCAVIPTIPPRSSTLLLSALKSVSIQERPVDQISIAIDNWHDGAWKTRQRAVDAAQTDWIAFLDDDDEWYPQHIDRLLNHAIETDADYVYSYFDTQRTADVLGNFNKTFDPKEPTHTTMTVLVRTQLAQSVRFTPRAPEHIAGGEDHRFIVGCVKMQAKIVHLPEQTWFWRIHSGN